MERAEPDQRQLLLRRHGDADHGTDPPQGSLQLLLLAGEGGKHRNIGLADSRHNHVVVKRPEVENRLALVLLESDVRGQGYDLPRELMAVAGEQTSHGADPAAQRFEQKPVAVSQRLANAGQGDQRQQQRGSLEQDAEGLSGASRGTRAQWHGGLSNDAAILPRPSRDESKSDGSQSGFRDRDSAASPTAPDGPLSGS